MKNTKNIETLSFATTPTPFEKLKRLHFDNLITSINDCLFDVGGTTIITNGIYDFFYNYKVKNF